MVKVLLLKQLLESQQVVNVPEEPSHLCLCGNEFLLVASEFGILFVSLIIITRNCNCIIHHSCYSLLFLWCNLFNYLIINYYYRISLLLL